MTDVAGLMMARKIAEEAGRRVHRLAPYLVDGTHAVSQAAFDSTMAYLSRCPLTGAIREEDMGRARTGQDVAAAGLRPVITDIGAGFYATPGRTGNNDLDFWKVRVSRKGYRSVARVIGGGSEQQPRLVEITNPEQRKALGAILRAGIDAAADAYADNEQRCKKCGIHLTDDDSRAARMGPKCRGDR